MALRGLARIPRRVARQLSDAGHTCAIAAAGLERAVRAEGDAHEAMLAAADAERQSHQAALASASMFGGGVDREDIVGIARALQHFAGSVEEAAYAMGHVPRRTAPWAALAGVIRDGAREVAAAIDSLDGAGTDCHAHLDRADELFDEWRKVVRPARARALDEGAESSTAVAIDMALTRLELAEAACRRAGREVRFVAIKHA